MFRDFLRGVPRGFIAAFRGRNILFHLFAITLTALFVLTSFDWWYFTQTRGGIFQSISLPAAIIGFFVPILAPVGLYWYGAFRNSNKTMQKAAILAHAGILGWIISSTYKAFTGRIQPEFLTYTSFIDNSRDFNFGFWEHGIFWGWPSSHTTVAFAMSVALVYLYPRNKMLAAVALLYALFIGIGVSVSVHWFSDFVAGMIIGSVVGFAVTRKPAK